MNNVWIVTAITSTDVDLSGFVSDLRGGYVAPDKYTKHVFNKENQKFEETLVDHPKAGQSGPDFSERIVFVNTSEGYVSYEGVVHLEDFAEHNIARWLNSGINYAIDHGAERVVVLSGPSSFDTTALEDIIGQHWGTEVVNISDGAMFIINGTSSARLDEQFKIWFWADDFYRTLGSRFASGRTDFLNFKELTPYIVDTEELYEIVKVDQENYNNKWK